MIVSKTEKRLAYQKADINIVKLRVENVESPQFLNTEATHTSPFG